MRRFSRRFGLSPPSMGGSHALGYTMLDQPRTRLRRGDRALRPRRPPIARFGSLPNILTPSRNRPAASGLPGCQHGNPWACLHHTRLGVAPATARITGLAAADRANYRKLGGDAQTRHLMFASQLTRLQRVGYGGNIISLSKPGRLQIALPYGCKLITAFDWVYEYDSD